MRILRILLGGALLLGLTACEHNGKKFPDFEFTGNIFPEGPAQIR